MKNALDLLSADPDRLRTSGGRSRLLFTLRPAAVRQRRMGDIAPGFSDSILRCRPSGCAPRTRRRSGYRHFGRRVLGATLAIAVLTGCGRGDYKPEYDGAAMYKLFPFDGLRTWEFVSDDEDLSYGLVATMRDPEGSETVSGTHLYTVDYAMDCRGPDQDCVQGEVLRTITWSSQSDEGVRVHDYEDADGFIAFEPPIQVADATMKRGDVAETDGSTWTSSLGATESCQVRLNVNWPDCAHFTLDDGDDDETTNPGLVGEYWAIASYNVVTISLTADLTVVDDNEVGQWELSKHECTDGCDGHW